MFKQIKLNSPITYFVGFLGAAALAFFGRALWYYHGVYVGPSVPESTLQSVTSLSNTYSGAAHIYTPGNLAIFDTGHDNGFTEEEMGLLAGRLASGGAQVEFIDSDLPQRLHQATVLVVTVPSSTFNREEVIAVEQFVKKGGRLILIGDPTRVRNVDGLNSLASEFGVVYQADYIYNLEKNDGNFRNVIFSNFAKDSPLTDGVKSVVFQTAHSLQAAQDAGIIMGDDNTFVSSSEKPGGVIAVALTGDGNVLSLSDMTFLTAPYNSFADNDRFIDNVVNFALSGQREFTVDDFPYYFGAATDVVYQDSTMLDKSFDDFNSLRDVMNKAEKSVVLAKSIGSERPYIYLATYDAVDDSLKTELDVDGVKLDSGEITIKGVTTLEAANTVMFHLVAPPKSSDTGKSSNSTQEPPTQPPYHLIVLADSKDALSKGIKELVAGQIADCVVTPTTAVCHLENLEGGGTPGSSGGNETPTPGASVGTFLAVADDVSAGSADLTSAPAIQSALTSGGHKVDLVSVTNDGLPSVDQMMKYDGVFWSSGGYAPTSDGVKLLKTYLDGGGKLFIDGAETAFNWQTDPFLSDYLRAAYVSYGPQSDLQAAANSHPLSQGFGGSVIKLESGTPPDVIDAKGSDVVFVRGPDSQQPGKPAIVAYETTSGRRVAFAAFQVSLMDKASLNLLITNAAAWFLSTQTSQ